MRGKKKIMYTTSPATCVCTDVWDSCDRETIPTVPRAHVPEIEEAHGNYIVVVW